MIQDSTPIRISFEMLVTAAQKLPITQKRMLVKSLRLPEFNFLPARQGLIAELEKLRNAGALSEEFSLRNAFANQDAPEVSEDELLLEIRSVATEWKEELDEFYSTSR